MVKTIAAFFSAMRRLVVRFRSTPGSHGFLSLAATAGWLRCGEA